MYVYIIYLDANHLHGWTMNQYFLSCGFEWLSQEENKNVDVNSMELLSIGENSSDRYILKFDLEYPDEFYDFHNDYLLAPEKLEISNDMLSKHCSEIVPNLGNKKK